MKSTGYLGFVSQKSFQIPCIYWITACGCLSVLFCLPRSRTRNSDILWSVSPKLLYTFTFLNSPHWLAWIKYRRIQSMFCFGIFFFSQLNQTIFLLECAGLPSVFLISYQMSRAIKFLHFPSPVLSHNSVSLQKHHSLNLPASVAYKSLCCDSALIFFPLLLSPTNLEPIDLSSCLGDVGTILA